MSLGLEAAYGNEGLYARLRQQVMDQVAEQQRKTQNDLQLRASDRADRALNQQDELTRLKIAETANEQANKEADRQIGLANKANEAVPAGTVFPSIDNKPSTAPIVGRLSMVGALAPTAGSLGSTTDTPADPKTGTPPSGRLIAIPSGQVKLPSANQANVLADNARADAKDAEAARRAAQNLPLVPVGPRGILTPHDQAIGQPVYQPPHESNGRKPAFQEIDAISNMNSAEIQSVKVLRQLQQSGIDQSNDPFDPRFNTFLTNTLKVRPIDEGKADSIQRTNYVKAVLARAIMGGRPSQYTMQMIEQHLPDSHMSGKQLAGVIHDVLDEVRTKRVNMQNFYGPDEAKQMEPVGGETYQQYLSSQPKTNTASGGWTIKR